MARLWQAFCDGFTGAFRAFGALAKVFLIYLPCIALFVLPAMAVGYCWCWIIGGFRAGILLFDGDSERIGPMRLHIDLRTPDTGASHE